MKLTSLAIVFVIIIAPFLLIAQLQTKTIHEDSKLRVYYDSILDNAVQDAAWTLSSYQTQMSYDEGFTFENARQATVDTLFDSMYFAFNVYGNTSGMARVNGCMPLVIFLEADGFVPYVLHEYVGAGGYRIIDYSWYPKRHYIGTVLSDRFVVRYTLTDQVYVYDQTNGTETSGSYQDYAAAITQFADAGSFENLRLAAVSSAIEKDINYFIRQLNQLNLKMGIGYSFHFPRIEDADWNRALLDEGLLVFAQGFPVLTGKRYETYALGGARLLRKQPLVGYTYNSIKRYCKETCTYYLNTVSTDPVFDANTLQFYSTREEAASNGYYPCPICKP